MAVARGHCPTVPASDAHGRAEHGGIWQLFTSTAACFCAFSQEQFQHLSGQSKHNLLLFSSAFKRSCLLPDHLASPARHAWWPQTLHLCSSRTWESRADPGERTHLQYMGMGKAPGSGAENEAGNHCNNFNLHGNNKKKKILTSLSAFRYHSNRLWPLGRKLEDSNGFSALPFFFKKIPPLGIACWWTGKNRTSAGAWLITGMPHSGSVRPE